VIEPYASPYRVDDPESFSVSECPTSPSPDAPDRPKRRLKDLVEELDDLQRLFYADDRYSLLLVFQAMDASGKDSTIRAVLSGANPAGFQVSAFKQPSNEELDHDFLWRSAARLPERGRIGVFNRSYYEEVLVVRVHPEYLQGQALPPSVNLDTIWEGRFRSIREHERHLAENGTVVLKFWLNVSRDEQCRRFLARIDDESKNWKFSSADVTERGFWDDYMHAYEEAIRATSRPWAPWYAIPADSKPQMRLAVAEVVVGTLRRLGLEYPKAGPDQVSQLEELREQLAAELPGD
jgi:PPK2 family polyphosphate:nucleotide phosphotransferase